MKQEHTRNLQIGHRHTLFNNIITNLSSSCNLCELQLKELRQKTKLARNCPEIAQNATPGASKCKRFFEEVPHTLKGSGPHPTPNLTWHCMPRWWLCLHFCGMYYVAKSILSSAHVQFLHEVVLKLNKIKKINSWF